MEREDQPGPALPAHRIGLGALPSRVDSDMDPGHVWVFWEREPSVRPTARGYYPLLNRIPRQYADMSRWRDYFFEHSAPGARFRDTKKARDYARRHPTACAYGAWPVMADGLSRARRRCWIPAAAAYVPEGQYSFDTTVEGWDNCASWAIKVLHYATADPTSFPLPRPARVKAVIASLRDVAGGHE